MKLSEWSSPSSLAGLGPSCFCPASPVPKHNMSPRAWQGLQAGKEAGGGDLVVGEMRGPGPEGTCSELPSIERLCLEKLGGGEDV